MSIVAGIKDTDSFRAQNHPLLQCFCMKCLMRLMLNFHTVGSSAQLCSHSSERLLTVMCFKRLITLTAKKVHILLHRPRSHWPSVCNLSIISSQ